MERILSGRKVAEKIITELKNIRPKRKLGILRVGDDPGSTSYINGIKKVAVKIGTEIILEELDENISENDIKKSILKMKKNDIVDGILFMEPLPDYTTASDLTEFAGKELDVEGIHPYNMGKMMLGYPNIVPSTAQAVIELIDFYNIETEGKNITILGRSNVVGKPLVNLLLRKTKIGNATVTVCHSKTKNIKDMTIKADILVVAIGKAKFITEEYLKDNAIVIDVGINMKDDKIVGDVDFNSAEKKALAITPVPGGIGSITTSVLFFNLYKL